MSVEQYLADSKRWLAQARADLRAAEGSVRNETYEWAAFQAQQAGEKALKSLWLFHARDPRGHSVAALVRDFPLADVGATIAGLLGHGKRLDKLYILTRYPSGLPDLIPAEVFTAEDAAEAIESARAIIGTVAGLTAEASPKG